ncbi:MAG: hypothetical protein ACI9WU_002965 [Myxococcota bacterium]|jgi:hypothetical protein
MFVKYQTIRNVVIVAAAAGGIYWFVTRPDPPPEKPPKQAAYIPPAPVRPRVPPPIAPEPVTGPPQLHNVANRLLRPADEPKSKNVLGRSGPKVNLYDDDRDGAWDRAKVDHNRDDEWDEKWTVKAGRIERKFVHDGALWTWADGAWLGQGAPVAKPLVAMAPDTAMAPTAAPVERARILTLIRARASGKKAKDVLGPGQPKVNLYDDDGDGAWDRAKVDDDRDGEPEEKWTVKNGTVERALQSDGRVLIPSPTGWIAKP